jgi:hypothetical protein
LTRLEIRPVPTATARAAGAEPKILVLFHAEQRHDGGCVTLSVMAARPGRQTLNSTENVMSKLLALATALVLAFTSCISTAQAGMRGVGIGIGIGVGLGAMGAMSNSGRGSYEAREYRQRKKERVSRREREEKAPVRSAKKSKSDKSEKTEQAAKESAEETPASTATTEPSGIATTGAPVVAPVSTGATATADAQTENSSISLASASNDEAPVKKIDTASQEPTGKNLDCKKFFPSVGMTLSVPCE